MQKIKELKYVAALAVTLLVLAGCGRDEDQVAKEGVGTPQVATPTPQADAPAQPADAPASATEPANTADATSTINDVDRDFATRSFGSSIAEVQAGRLAAEKTLDEDV